MVFAEYARYYNLLYHDKDYASESGFVLDVLERNGCKPETLLDLGCGTGRHAVEMAQKGIRVTGVDMSEMMLSMGMEMLKNVNGIKACVPELHLGDVRNVRLGRTFDAAVSLFHVMSYQNNEEDASGMLKSARAHLKPGGMFFFDFWYGPGVLTDLPQARTRELEDASCFLVRKATPDLKLEENTVVVKYNVELTEKENGRVKMFEESHTMRYWFFPELRSLARDAGFHVMDQGPWMKHGNTEFAWNAWMLLEAEV